MCQPSKFKLNLTDFKFVMNDLKSEQSNKIILEKHSRGLNSRTTPSKRFRRMKLKMMKIFLVNQLTLHFQIRISNSSKETQVRIKVLSILLISFKENYIFTKGLVLPPGLDDYVHQAVGHLHIKIGKIISLKSHFKKEKAKIRVKFWGDQGQGVILGVEADGNLPTEVKYAVVVPKQNFKDYLHDIKEQRFFILDPRNNKAIGFAKLNFAEFLDSSNSNLFAPIHGNFAICKLGHGGKNLKKEDKIGDICIEVSCDFGKVGKENRKERQGMIEDTPLKEIKLKNGVKETPSFKINPEKQNLEKSMGSVPTNLTNKFDDLLQKGEKLRERMKLAEEMLKATQESSQLEEQKESGVNYNLNEYSEKRKVILKDQVDLDVMAKLENESRQQKPGVVEELIIQMEKEKRQENLLKEEKIETPVKEEIFIEEAIHQQLTPTKFTEIDGFIITVNEGVCSHKGIRDKMFFGNGFVEVLFPSLKFQDHDLEQVSYDQYRIEIQEEPKPGKYIFSKRFSQNLKITANNFKQFINSKVVLKLKAEVEGPKGKQIVAELAEGELELSEIYVGGEDRKEYTIQMFSTIPHTKQPRSRSKSNPKLKKKKKLTKRHIIGNITLFGEIMSASLPPPPLPKQQKPLNYDIQIPIQLQLYLYVGSGQKISLRKDKNPRNIFIRYKIPSSNEFCSTSTQWRTQHPTFDHRMIMSLGQKDLVHLFQFGFVVETWDKKEDTADELIGLTKISFTNLQKSIIDSNTGHVNFEWLKSSVYPVTIADDSLGIFNLKSRQMDGYLETVLAIGTPIQVNKFGDKLKNISGLQATSNKQLRRTSQHYSQSDQKSNSASKSIQVDIEKEESEMYFDGVYVKNVGIGIGNSHFEENKSSAKKVESHVLNVKQSVEQKSLTIHSLRLKPLDIFLRVLEQIRRKKLDVTQMLKDFIVEINTSRLSLLEFTRFMGKLDQKLPHMYLQRFTQLFDSEQKGFIYPQDFINSYNAYLNYEELLRKETQQVFSLTQALMEEKGLSIEHLDWQLSESAEFGFIQKGALKKLLGGWIKGLKKEDINLIVNVLDSDGQSFLNTKDFTHYLTTLKLYKRLFYVNLSNQFYEKKILQHMRDELQFKGKQVQDFIKSIVNLGNQNKKISARSLQKLFLDMDIELSYWEVCVVMKNISDYEKIRTGFSFDDDE